MKINLNLLIGAVIYSLLTAANSYAAQNKALVIGVSQYSEINSLRYADADALEFSQMLTDFANYPKSNVSLLLNQEATKKRITEEINKVVQSSAQQPLNSFILMFAGHGIEGTLSASSANERAKVKETNIFLAPTDASIEAHNFYSTGKGKEVSNETFINKAWLARQLSAIKAKSIIVILDSCYSGTKSFGTLFLENEGYSVEGFSTGNSRKMGVADVKRRKLTLIKSGTDTVNGKKIAYLASSRDNQPSVEYDELQHGALSYSIFEHVKRVRRTTPKNTQIVISVEDVYANIVKLFNETTVQGEKLSASHQPMLIPIPDFSNVKDMGFISVLGTNDDMSYGSGNKSEAKKGILRLVADLNEAEIFVDGEKLSDVKETMTLNEGKHFIELSLPKTGYRYSFMADIKASTPFVQKVATRGKLSIATFWVKKGVKTPGPELDVYIDGKKIGKTKLTQDNLLVGSHLVEVEYQNVKKSRNVEIRPGSPLVLNYTMAIEQAPPVDNSGVGNVTF